MEANEYSKHWQLDKDIIFLNHGSFGACPTTVLEKQTYYRELMEKEPVAFFIRKFDELYYNSKKALAELITANTNNIVFVPNATAGANAVLHSLKFNPGDELLTTNHVYGACRNLMTYICNRTGAKLVVADVPFPIKKEEQVTEAVLSKVNDKTKIALIDHITSPTGLIFPVEQIVKELSAKGIDAIVDGAHAPGSIPLNVEAIGAAYYTGNCHKWLCTPKGAAFLYVRPDKQKEIHPAIISHPHVNHSANPHSQFQSEFYWTGTNDFSAYLCVTDAIKFMDSLLEGGIKKLMGRNRNLTLKVRDMISDVLSIKPAAPKDMIASLCSFPLPDGSDSGSFPFDYIDPVQDLLFEDYKIEIPVMFFPAPPNRLIRTSVQIYNSIEQYNKLAEALKEIFG
jgi:isopenicillin-N epimerase